MSITPKKTSETKDDSSPKQELTAIEIEDLKIIQDDNEDEFDLIEEVEL